ncbi:MAG TPA: RNase adapter RapZ [Terriglobia bacterium]|nr:RNase adapter RapZ [Terriglobia bacterium]
MKTASVNKPNGQFVVITGLSGSGKGSVLKAFEDLGYYCVDNLPVGLIPKFAELCQLPDSHIERAAVVADIREGEALRQLPAMYQSLDRTHTKVSLVFLESTDHALMRRFGETRRPHPMGRDLPVREGIRLERMLLKPMRKLADVVIDTTRMNVHELRDFVQLRFGEMKARGAIFISVISFGFRFGVPPDAELVFDVRFLPNPNYVPRLKSKTGRDDAVQKFMDTYPQTQEFMDRLKDFLLYLLPHYIHEGKNYLTIAIGCTGGRHRSVALSERTASVLAAEGYRTKIVHRDIGRSSS